MNKTFLIPVLCLTILVASSVSGASIELTPEYSLQMPFPHPVYQSAFGDIDGDGTPELLARMINFVALYSISGDSLLFRRKYGGDTVVTSIVFGDVNRDHLLDIVVGLGHMCYEECPMYSLEAYDGSTKFQARSTFEYRAGDEPWHSLWPDFVTSYMGVLVLQSIDLNHDGVNELFLSYDNRRRPDPRFRDIYSGGSSYLFHSFPDSILWKSDNSYLSLIPIEQPAGNNSFLTEYGWYETGFYFENMNSSVWSLNANDSKSILAITPFDELCPAPFESHFFYHPLCSGRIATLTDSATFLVSATGWTICDSGWNSLGNQLQLRRFTPGDTNNLIWTRERPEGEFAFHPSHPGYFFGISTADSLASRFAVHLSHGKDGSEIAVSEAISANYVRWDTSFPDGFPRMIALLENRVIAYRIEVSASVEMDQSDHLPDAFTLNRPFPNPFNAEVTIPLSLPKRAEIQVEIFNLLGQKVAELWNGSMNPGEQVVRWNAGRLPSAVYFIRATALGETKTAKVVLLK